MKTTQGGNLRGSPRRTPRILDSVEEILGLGKRQLRLSRTVFLKGGHVLCNLAPHMESRGLRPWGQARRADRQPGIRPGPHHRRSMVQKMLNSHWLSTPFVLQMLCMAADEFWFHKKRGLPRWERIGHPLDTLTVILCLAWILLVAPSRRTVVAFVLLAAFSCVFVTKDEPVHQSRCQAAEQWLHALLFMLHPIALASAAFLWPAIWGLPGSFSRMARFCGFERAFLASVCAMMIGFGVYQFVSGTAYGDRKEFRGKQ